MAATAGTAQLHEQHQHPTNAISTLQVRQLQHADITEAAGVISDSFQIGAAFGGWLQPLFKMGICEDFRSRLHLSEPERAVCFVAAVDVPAKVVVGVIEISARSMLYNPAPAKRYAYISNLAVDSDHRRLGIGAKLIRQCESIAKEWGFTDIYLHVMASNQDGQQLYLKLGFEVLSSDWTWQLFPWRKAERLFLRKRL
jgi:ribosomal protein S18 acetylase RimI-like enzyme